MQSNSSTNYTKDIVYRESHINIGHLREDTTLHLIGERFCLPKKKWKKCSVVSLLCATKETTHPKKSIVAANYIILILKIVGVGFLHREKSNSGFLAFHQSSFIAEETSLKLLL